MLVWCLRALWLVLCLSLLPAVSFVPSSLRAFEGRGGIAAGFQLFNFKRAVRPKWIHAEGQTRRSAVAAKVKKIATTSPKRTQKRKRTTPPATVAVLVDAENVNPDLVDLVMEEVEEWGSVAVKRAYADWSRDFPLRNADTVEKHLFRKLHQQSLPGKGSSDTLMICDAMELVYTQPEIETFVLITSDADFSVLSAKLRKMGKVVFGFCGSLSFHLERSVDRCVLGSQKTQRPSRGEQTGAVRAVGGNLGGGAGRQLVSRLRQKQSDDLVRQALEEIDEDVEVPLCVGEPKSGGEIGKEKDSSLDSEETAFPGPDAETESKLSGWMLQAYEILVEEKESDAPVESESEAASRTESSTWPSVSIGALEEKTEELIGCNVGAHLKGLSFRSFLERLQGEWEVERVGRRSFVRPVSWERSAWNSEVVLDWEKGEGVAEIRGSEETLEGRGSGDPGRVAADLLVYGSGDDPPELVIREGNSALGGSCVVDDLSDQAVVREDEKEGKGKEQEVDNEKEEEKEWTKSVEELLNERDILPDGAESWERAALEVPVIVDVWAQEREREDREADLDKERKKREQEERKWKELEELRRAEEEERQAEIERRRREAEKERLELEAKAKKALKEERKKRRAEEAEAKRKKEMEEAERLQQEKEAEKAGQGQPQEEEKEEGMGGTTESREGESNSYSNQSADMDIREALFGPQEEEEEGDITEGEGGERKGGEKDEGTASEESQEAAGGTDQNFFRVGSMLGNLGEPSEMWGKRSKLEIEFRDRLLQEPLPSDDELLGAICDVTSERQHVKWHPLGLTGRVKDLMAFTRTVCEARQEHFRLLAMGATEETDKRRMNAAEFEAALHNAIYKARHKRFKSEKKEAKEKIKFPSVEERQKRGEKKRKTKLAIDEIVGSRGDLPSPAKRGWWSLPRAEEAPDLQIQSNGNLPEVLRWWNDSLSHEMQWVGKEDFSQSRTTSSALADLLKTWAAMLWHCTARKIGDPSIQQASTLYTVSELEKRFRGLARKHGHSSVFNLLRSLDAGDFFYSREGSSELFAIEPRRQKQKEDLLVTRLLRRDDRVFFFRLKKDLHAQVRKVLTKAHERAHLVDEADENSGDIRRIMSLSKLMKERNSLKRLKEKRSVLLARFRALSDGEKGKKKESKADGKSLDQVLKWAPKGKRAYGWRILGPLTSKTFDLFPFVDPKVFPKSFEKHEEKGCVSTPPRLDTLVVNREASDPLWIQTATLLEEGGEGEERQGEDAGGGSPYSNSNLSTDSNGSSRPAEEEAERPLMAGVKLGSPEALRSFKYLMVRSLLPYEVSKITSLWYDGVKDPYKSSKAKWEQHDGALSPFVGRETGSMQLPLYSDLNKKQRECIFCVLGHERAASIRRLWNWEPPEDSVFFNDMPGIRGQTKGAEKRIREGKDALRRRGELLAGVQLLWEVPNKERRRPEAGKEPQGFSRAEGISPADFVNEYLKNYSTKDDRIQSDAFTYTSTSRLCRSSLDSASRSEIPSDKGFVRLLRENAETERGDDAVRSRARALKLFDECLADLEEKGEGNGRGDCDFGKAVGDLSESWISAKTQTVENGNDPLSLSYAREIMDGWWHIRLLQEMIQTFEQRVREREKERERAGSETAVETSDPSLLQFLSYLSEWYDLVDGGLTLRGPVRQIESLDPSIQKVWKEVQNATLPDSRSPLSPESDKHGPQLLYGYPSLGQSLQTLQSQRPNTDHSLLLSRRDRGEEKEEASDHASFLKNVFFGQKFRGTPKEGGGASPAVKLSGSEAEGPRKRRASAEAFREDCTESEDASVSIAERVETAWGDLVKSLPFLEEPTDPFHARLQLQGSDGRLVNGLWGVANELLVGRRVLQECQRGRMGNSGNEGSAFLAEREEVFKSFPSLRSHGFSFNPLGRANTPEERKVVEAFRDRFWRLLDDRAVFSPPPCFRHPDLSSRRFDQSFEPSHGDSQIPGCLEFLATEGLRFEDLLWHTHKEILTQMPNFLSAKEAAAAKQNWARLFLSGSTQLQLHYGVRGQGTVVFDPHLRELATRVGSRQQNAWGKLNEIAVKAGEHKWLLAREFPGVSTVMDLLAVRATGKMPRYLFDRTTIADIERPREKGGLELVPMDSLLHHLFYQKAQREHQLQLIESCQRERVGSRKGTEGEGSSSGSPPAPSAGLLFRTSTEKGGEQMEERGEPVEVLSRGDAEVGGVEIPSEIIPHPDLKYMDLKQQIQRELGKEGGDVGEEMGGEGGLDMDLLSGPLRFQPQTVFGSPDRFDPLTSDMHRFTPLTDEAVRTWLSFGIQGSFSIIQDLFDALHLPGQSVPPLAKPPSPKRSAGASAGDAPARWYTLPLDDGNVVDRYKEVFLERIASTVMARCFVASAASVVPALFRTAREQVGEYEDRQELVEDDLKEADNLASTALEKTKNVTKGEFVVPSAELTEAIHVAQAALNDDESDEEESDELTEAMNDAPELFSRSLEGGMNPKMMSVAVRIANFLWEWQTQRRLHFRRMLQRWFSRIRSVRQFRDPSVAHYLLVNEVHQNEVVEVATGKRGEEEIRGGEEEIRTDPEAFLRSLRLLKHTDQDTDEVPEIVVGFYECVFRVLIDAKAIREGKLAAGKKPVKKKSFVATMKNLQKDPQTRQKAINVGSERLVRVFTGLERSLGQLPLDLRCARMQSLMSKMLKDPVANSQVILYGDQLKEELGVPDGPPDSWPTRFSLADRVGELIGKFEKKKKKRKAGREGRRAGGAGAKQGDERDGKVGAEGANSLRSRISYALHDWLFCDSQVASEMIERNEAEFPEVARVCAEVLDLLEFIDRVTRAEGYSEEQAETCTKAAFMMYGEMQRRIAPFEVAGMTHIPAQLLKFWWKGKEKRGGNSAGDEKNSPSEETVSESERYLGYIYLKMCEALQQAKLTESKALKPSLAHKGWSPDLLPFRTAARQIDWQTHHIKKTGEGPERAPSFDTFHIGPSDINTTALATSPWTPYEVFPPSLSLDLRASEASRDAVNKPRGDTRAESTILNFLDGVTDKRLPQSILPRDYLLAVGSIRKSEAHDHQIASAVLPAGSHETDRTLRFARTVCREKAAYKDALRELDRRFGNTKYEEDKMGRQGLKESTLAMRKNIRSTAYILFAARKRMYPRRETFVDTSAMCAMLRLKQSQIREEINFMSSMEDLMKMKMEERGDFQNLLQRKRTLQPEEPGSSVGESDDHFDKWDWLESSSDSDSDSDSDSEDDSEFEKRRKLLRDIREMTGELTELIDNPEVPASARKRATGILEKLTRDVRPSGISEVSDVIQTLEGLFGGGGGGELQASDSDRVAEPAARAKEEQEGPGGQSTGLDPTVMSDSYDELLRSFKDGEVEQMRVLPLDEGTDLAELGEHLARLQNQPAGDSDGGKQPMVDALAEILRGDFAREMKRQTSGVLENWNFDLDGFGENVAEKVEGKEGGLTRIGRVPDPYGDSEFEENEDLPADWEKDFEEMEDEESEERYEY